ncbi:hypothetical protein PVAR5_0804 [Paecilomyces variotii No. 5]|uniref:Uncharacterized protein n=1 Tax=Byssochlamys spectabilis (strain No. 5 / NBRC 109023) TaxID=1356009 RepID=V5F8F7_BYSSN|nr:hypothetical protein PVAR5_0804 [Paecilomyces variotii No. 5]
MKLTTVLQLWITLPFSRTVLADPKVIAYFKQHYEGDRYAEIPVTGECIEPDDWDGKEFSIQVTEASCDIFIYDRDAPVDPCGHSFYAALGPQGTDGMSIREYYSWSIKCYPDKACSSGAEEDCGLTIEL